MDDKPQMTLFELPEHAEPPRAISKAPAIVAEEQEALALPRKRCYYTHPIEASAMHRWFGMEFENDADFAGIKRLTEMYATDEFCDDYLVSRPDGSRCSAKLYIHTNSIGILTPQAGDLLYDGSHAWIAVRSGGNVTIFQRDGKPFCWPRSEIF